VTYYHLFRPVSKRIAKNQSNPRWSD
jgi:hypothetical protein